MLLHHFPLQKLTVQTSTWLSLLLSTSSPLAPARFHETQRPSCQLQQRREAASTPSCSGSGCSELPSRPFLRHIPGRDHASSSRGFSRRALSRKEDEALHLKLEDVLSFLPAVPQQGPSLDRGTSVSSVSQVIFDSCWRRFEDRHQLGSVHVPKEVIWLNGAPGSGKGANATHIVRTRGLEHCISMSDLLKSHPESRDIVNGGDMVPDAVVGGLLLEALLTTCTAPEGGILIDGFPRTSMQVDFLKLLSDKLSDLHAVWANTQHEAQFPRPLFKVVMLYVSEETSIARQMARAEMACLHNKRVMDAGAANFLEQRTTDASIEKSRKRYAIFKQHYDATLRLKQFFPFHLIDSMGTLGQTQEAITMELRYQSSLELGHDTHQAIMHLPVAKDLVQHARQQLVSRLDDHCGKSPQLFHKVIDVVTAEIMPVLQENGMAGEVEYVSDLHLFNEQACAAQMLIDILTDRGFRASHSAEVTHVPVQMDLATGIIRSRKETQHRFRVAWDMRGVRDANTLELDARGAPEPASLRPHVSQSFRPASPTTPPSRRDGAVPKDGSRAAVGSHKLNV